MRVYGSVATGGTGARGIDVPTEPVRTGRDVVADLERRGSRRPPALATSHAPEPPPVARPAPQPRPRTPGTGHRARCPCDPCQTARATAAQARRDAAARRRAEIGANPTLVRAWARAAGIDVAASGYLPLEVLEAFAAERDAWMAQQETAR